MEIKHFIILILSAILMIACDGAVVVSETPTYYSYYPTYRPYYYRYERPMPRVTWHNSGPQPNRGPVGRGGRIGR